MADRADGAFEVIAGEVSGGASVREQDGPGSFISPEADASRMAQFEKPADIGDEDEEAVALTSG